MLKQLESKFDAVSLILLLVLFFGAICLTSVVKHILFFFLPIVFLLKKFVFRASFLKEISYQRTPLISILVWQLTLIPWLMAFIHGDWNSMSLAKLQWLNHYNSWIILYSYLASNYFLLISSKNKIPLFEKYPLNFIVLIILFIAFEVDFIYALIKWFNNDFGLTRWQGSSGNPQLWAIQASIMFLLWLIGHKEINKLTKQKIFSRIFLLTIILAIIFSGSISNLIGLAFASLAWLLASPILALVIVLLYLLVVNFITIKFLLSYQGSIDELRNVLAGFAHKFIPRIKLWLNLLNEAPKHHLDYFWGMGVEAYNNFMAQATAGHHKNAHNLYFHNWLTNGLPGLYLGSIFLFNSIKQILNNKYLLAITLYIISSSVFDCALTFIEVQMLFWLILPLLVDMNEKSSNGTALV